MPAATISTEPPRAAYTMSPFNRWSDRLQLSTRLALNVGFGGLLIIIALAGIDTSRVLHQVRSSEDQIRQQFLFRNHVLNVIRSDLYLSGTYVRDYLLDPDPQRAESFKRSLESVRTEMTSAFASYESHLQPQEGEHYEELRTELANYWKVLDPVLVMDTQQRRQTGYAFLRDEVFPRRAAMLEIAGRIADLNEQQLNAGNERVGSLLSAFQTRLAVTLLLSLLIGIGMAMFIGRKILKLEANAHAQYQEVSEARKQLEHLSARLVNAQETERRSLARELHDEVGQSLSAVLVEVRNLSVDLPVKPAEELHEHVETINSLVEGTIRTVRNMSLLLRPSMLDDLGLVPALRWQAREVSKRTGIDVNVTADLVSEDLPDEYKTCIYRVVQEALHNCSRHSQATAVQIKVQQESHRLLLSILDNGQGFDVKQSRGMGLLGIDERVSHLGGKCDVLSEPGSGTILKVELPYEP